MSAPGTLADILRRSGILLRAHGFTIAMAYAVVTAPAWVAQAAALDDPDPLSGLNRLAGLLAIALPAPVTVGATAFVARVVRGEARVGVLRTAREGLAGWGRLVPATLVYGNRLAVGVIALVVPGVVWWIGGRYLTQVVTLAPDEEPFAGSLARVRGDWARQAALSVAAGLTSVGAQALVGVMPIGVAAAAGVIVATVWVVVDTVAFLARDAERGPAHRAALGLPAAGPAGAGAVGGSAAAGASAAGGAGPAATGNYAAASSSSSRA